MPIPDLKQPSSSLGSGTNVPVDSPWAILHVDVLPLFNGEPLRIPIEDLNARVREHIQAVVEVSFVPFSMSTI